MLYAPSGYMIELTAEQKICQGKFFGCVDTDKRGIPKGERLGSVFVPLGRAKGTAQHPETPLPRKLDDGNPCGMRRDTVSYFLQDKQLMQTPPPSSGEIKKHHLSTAFKHTFKNQYKPFQQFKYQNLNNMKSMWKSKENLPQTHI